tara:strand:+ start:506 stop:1324 length:819 start_codon:yes stop_codon:yes gene_type:complete
MFKLANAIFANLIPSYCFGDDGGGTPAPVDGGGTPAPVDGGGTPSFSFDSWDGQESSLPDDQKAAFAAFNKQRDQSNGEQTRRALVSALDRRYQQPRQPARQQPKQKEGDETLTRAQAEQLWRRQQADSDRNRRIDDFRGGMKELVGGINKFGDASVAFASQDEVDGFQTFIGDVLSKGITPKQLLKLHMFDKILAAHGKAAVSKFETSLKGRKTTITDGKSIGDPTPKSERDAPTDGGRGRVPSLEEFVALENPAAHKAIKDGKLNVLEHI